MKLLFIEEVKRKEMRDKEKRKEKKSIKKNLLGQKEGYGKKTLFTGNVLEAFKVGNGEGFQVQWTIIQSYTPGDLLL